jgi:dGTPase
MPSLSDRAAQAQSLLAPYAVPILGTLGREHSEEEDATRFPFQRDRDRIIHTQAFRRLKDKTQVFVAGHGDHYRTRITHTLEVAQIGRDMARTLQINEDLAEAIALAHDLGHTPFGHAGEEAMHACMQKSGKIFEHNEQSLRIVTLLETRTSLYQGLNLNKEILEGLMKHVTPHDHPTNAQSRSPSLEAQIVNIADEIAYTAHDTDDGVRAEQFTEADVSTTKLGALAAKHAAKRGTDIRGSIVDLLVTDLYEETRKNLQENNVHTLQDVYAASTPIVGFSPTMAGMLHEHRALLWDRFYRSPSVLQQAEHGKKVLSDLFERYTKHPPKKTLDLMKRTGSSKEEAIKDFIAGMTDGFAVDSVGT